MKRLRGIGVQLVIFFIIAISIPTFMLAIDVVVTTKSTQRSNMQLTSEQTLQETKKGFETYLKTLSQPIDLLTRKNEVKHLEDQGTIDDNVKAIQDSLCASVKVTSGAKRAFFTTKTGYKITGWVEPNPANGKTTNKKTVVTNANDTSKVWYKNSIGLAARNNVYAYMSDPYKDSETGDTIFTVSQEIKYTNNENYGVVGMDIDFSEVTEYVQNIGLLNTGYVLLVDSNGQVIVDNERNTYCSGSVTSLGFWDKLNSYKGSENEYGIKYDLPHAHMFVIEGMEKVRDVIEKNRKRKLTKHKKLSNNTIIEIDNCSPLEILKLQKNLLQIAEQEHITFVYGKGKRKPEIQQLYEELETCGERLMGYKECFEIMGKDRNSYSKTDLEATFMRMKEDHMLNGQLKAAYNIQIAVENYFIVQAYVSNDRTDYNTLIPVLEKHKKAFGAVLREVTADSGYCSEKNLLYLKKQNISSYIKLQDHEKRKTRAYLEDIGKYYNMKTQVFEDELYYVCHDGRELHHIRTETKEQAGYTQTFEVYGCSDCSGCEHKAKCLYKYDAEKDAEKNKVMKINEQWEALKEESHANIQSEKGILNRQIRSIQTEGHFGDIKENDGFRRFNYRTAEKVYKEFMLYAIGRNINKYHRFLYEKLRKFEGKTA